MLLDAVEVYRAIAVIGRGRALRAAFDFRVSLFLVGPVGRGLVRNRGQVIERDLGSLPEDRRRKLLRENVARLYNLKVSQPV